MRRTAPSAPLAAAILAPVLLAAACCGGPPSAPRPPEAVALPAELTRFGFGAPADPVRVTLVHTYADYEGKFRDARTGAVAERGLVWEFADPAPFWACFDGAGTTSFAEGKLPGAKAVLTVEAGPRTLWVHSYRGWASFEAPGADGRTAGTAAAGDTTGGDWHFTPEASDRVVDLLNRTAPVR